MHIKHTISQKEKFHHGAQMKAFAVNFYFFTAVSGDIADLTVNALI